MLGDYALEPSRVALGEELLALHERLGVQQPGNAKLLKEMAKPALAVLKMDGVVGPVSGVARTFRPDLWT